MADQSQFAWGASNSIGTITNLNSLAAGNIWHSASIADASPTRESLEISYQLNCEVAIGATDSVHFWVAGNDGAGTPLWPGGIGGTEGELSVAADIEDFLNAVGNPYHIHVGSANQSTNVEGMFTVIRYRPTWILCIQINGQALAATGNSVNYRYVTTQVETV